MVLGAGMVVEGHLRGVTGAAEARTGEEFLTLVRPSLSGAYRLAGFLLGDATEAEDAVQDALEKAWPAWPRLRDVSSFEAWFERIVANVCKDRLRARKGVRLVEIDAETASRSHGRDPFRAALARDEVGGLVRRLPPDQQIVVALRFWRDLSLEQIAERMDVPLGTVKSRLHYAMSALRKELDRQNGRAAR